MNYNRNSELAVAYYKIADLQNQARRDREAQALRGSRNNWFGRRSTLTGRNQPVISAK